MKGETIPADGDFPGDFYFNSLADSLSYDSSEDSVTAQFAAFENNAELDLDFSYESRDGLFEIDQHFAVWSKADIEAIRERLTSAIGYDGFL